MTPTDRSGTRPGRLRRVLSVWITILSAAAACSVAAGSQPMPAASGSRPVVADSGERWQDLTAAQKQFLQPLERDWTQLDPLQKRKWLVLTTRVPKMSVDERQRIQTRMTEWAKLTPEQRGQARLRYQQAKQVPARDRQARWDAYQSLSPEQKKQLAARASVAADGARKATQAPWRPERPGRDPAPKSNLVTSPGLAAAPKQIGPTLVQATPGATTTLITRPAAPPAHQQIGMPKIAATPEFVNRETLLPRRNPQGAAAGPATAASSAEATLRQ